MRLAEELSDDIHHAAEDDADGECGGCEAELEERARLVALDARRVELNRERVADGLLRRDEGHGEDDSRDEAEDERSRRQRHTADRHEVEAGNLVFGLLEEERHVAEQLVTRQPLHKVVVAPFDAVLSSHREPERFGARSHLGGGELHEAIREQILRELCDWARRGSRATPPHHVAPHELVAKEGADERGLPEAQPGGGRARAAVVDDGRHAREQPVVRARAHLEAEGGAVHLNLRPVGLHEHTLPGALGSGHDHIREPRRILDDHRAEAHKDGRGSL